MTVHDGSSNDLDRVREQWTELGRKDPLWAVLTERGKDNRRWDIEEFLRTGREEIDAVLSDVARVGGTDLRGTALDFGCGAGRLTQALAQRLGEAIGVDVSAGMIETAQTLNREGPRCRFVLNVAGDLSVLPTSCIDLAYSRRVLQHMAPGLAEGYIREFFRVVRPGGFVVFQIPSRPARSPKGIVIRLLPSRVATLLRRGMDMNGVAPARVRALVHEAGGDLLAELADDAAGSGWESWTYIAKVRVGEPGNRA